MLLFGLLIKKNFIYLSRAGSKIEQFNPFCCWKVIDIFVLIILCIKLSPRVKNNIINLIYIKIIKILINSI